MSAPATASDPRPRAPALLRARGLSLGYGANTVLEDVNLEVSSRDVLGIMGPAGAGKTTLLRALAGVDNPSPSFWQRGTIERIDGTDAATPAFGFLAQKDRLYAGSVLDALLPEQRERSDAEQISAAWDVLEPLGLWREFKDALHHPVLSLPLAAHKKLLIARLLAAAPRALFVDEPLSDVAVADESALLEFLRAIGTQRAVVAILHNKQQARRLCDSVCLVSGGRIVECTAARDFFATPATDCGREFIERGSGWLAQPVPAKPAPTERLPWSTAPILAEFRWVTDAVLGGAQCPGLLGNDAEDVRALQLLGVRHLVSLTEEPYDAARLAAAGIAATHFPVADMGVPTLAAAAALCRDVAQWLERGEATVFHCRAGLGRTGTLLACTLVGRGLDAGSAIQCVRRANPRYIQTDEQLRFVGEFQLHLEHRFAGDGSTDPHARAPAAVAAGLPREGRPLAAGPR